MGRPGRGRPRRRAYERLAATVTGRGRGVARESRTAPTADIAVARIWGRLGSGQCTAAVALGLRKTFRTVDGEQMPGVAISPRHKYELARALSDIGVHVMDVGFPAEPFAPGR